ncbi:MAG: antibiotic biosynthesis monooxygenase [Actinobacteria bacterium]|nr:antibiotic biosynthesis monooxygenase [Actinomycetota bacterium]
MIIVSGSLPIDADRRAEALDHVRAVAAATRDEPGNRTYRFTADLDDPGLLHFYEEWESGDALEAHNSAPHFVDFLGRIGPLVAGAPTGWRFEVTDSRSLF